MDLELGFSPNYFSLEDIIASQIKIPCKTEVTLHGFGYLDPSLNSENLPIGMELELPLWVAQVLAKPSRRYVSVNIPKKYKEAYREVLKADATVVDLNKMGPQFYQSGLHLSSLPNDEAEQIADILPQVLQRRLQSIADSYSYNTLLHSADESSTSKKGSLMNESCMDALEYRVYADARTASDRITTWFEKKI